MKKSKVAKPKGFWSDYSNCYEEAKKYTSRTDFHRGNSRAYVVAKRKGWFKDYLWFIDKRKEMAQGMTKWTYDACKSEALKYTTRGDFQRGNSVAYGKAREQGWIKDYDWFIDGHKRMAQRRTKWTYEACYKIAMECVSGGEMEKKNGSAYNASRENGWLKEYTWFTKRPSLTYEYCRECALKCKTRTDFNDRFGGAYNKSLWNGWIEDFDWLKRQWNSYRDNIDVVYAYFWGSANMCYVGRTNDAKRRDSQHRKNEKGTPFRISAETGLPIPKMTILERGLPLAEGLKKEADYVRKFTSEGWIVRNIAPTGYGSGSIGKLAHLKWTKNKCRIEAHKYQIFHDFCVGSPNCYAIARRRGWLKEYTWLQRNRKQEGYWDYENCYREAGNYTTISEFEHNSGSAYNAARKNGWLKDYIWFVSGRTEFANKRRKWDKCTCYREALKYKSVKLFREKANGAYKTAVRNGWVDDYEWLIRVCQKKGFYTYNRVMEDSKKYATPGQFKKGSPKYYDMAVNKGWIKDFTWLKKVLHDPWTFVSCMAEARKYSTLSEFRKSCGSAYVRAVKEGWIKRFGFLVRGENIPKAILQYTLDGHFVAKYKCANEAVAMARLQITAKSIRDCCNGKQKTCGGYVWRYDEGCEG